MIVVVEIVTVDAPPASVLIGLSRLRRDGERARSRQRRDGALRAADVDAVFTGNRPDIPSLEEQSNGFPILIGRLNMLRHRRVEHLLPRDMLLRRGPFPASLDTRSRYQDRQDNC